MRADEPIYWADIQTNFKYAENVENYINQLRVDRLMAKAREFRKEYDLQKRKYEDYALEGDFQNVSRVKKIAEAYESMAKRIKEGM